MYMNEQNTQSLSQATPRFYLVAVEKHLRDKVWKWPGKEATEHRH